MLALCVKAVARPARKMFDKLARLWRMRGLGHGARTWLETVNTEPRQRAKRLQNIVKGGWRVHEIACRLTNVDADMRRELGATNL